MEGGGLLEVMGDDVRGVGWGEWDEEGEVRLVEWFEVDGNVFV